MSLSMHLPDPERRPFAGTPNLDAFRAREELPPAQRALLELIDRLSLATGICDAGRRYMARDLNVSPRYVTTLIAQLREGGWIAITPVRNAPSILKVLKRPKEASGVWNRSSIGCGTVVPTRHGTTVPPKYKKYIIHAGESDGPGQGTLPFGRRRTFFNPARPRNYQDKRAAQQRLADAYRQGWFLFTQLDNAMRTVCAVRWSNTQAIVDLTDGRGSHLPPLTVAIPAADLGKWLWWR